MTRISLKSAANKISIHAPPRGATAVSATMSRLRDFNSRPSARGDPHTRVSADLRSDFNSRPSARGDLRDALWRSAQEFQFTPLREGRQNLDWAYKSIKISIHAPPRGATARCSQLYCDVLISIHAPPRGATKGRAHGNIGVTTFQFTPLREGRRCSPSLPVYLQVFQFTPLREGRPGNRRKTAPSPISIHAPPRGATQFSAICAANLRLFQFTPLREGRRANGAHVGVPSSHFNSRPSARGDAASAYSIHSQDIFQFTPLREGRLIWVSVWARRY